MRLTAAALLLGAILAAAPVALADTQLATTVSNGNTGTAEHMQAFDPPATAVADFNGDGRSELVAQNDNQNAYVLSTGDSRVLAELSPPYPPGWGARPLNPPTVQDVDADGRLDIVLTTSAATTCVYEYRPGQSTNRSFAFSQEWCHRADRFQGGLVAADGGPWVEDVTGDGLAEIFMQTEERGLFAYNHDGSVRWALDKYGGNAGPTVADLDRDGRKEAIFFGDGGEVRAIDARDGWVKWEFFAKDFVWPASIPVAGGTGDLDGDGLGEVAFAARNATQVENNTPTAGNHMAIFVLDHNGGLQWWEQPRWANPMSYTHPVIADVTGDGTNELLMQDWNTIGHKPGNWQVTGKANVFAYEGHGELLWRTVIDNSWSNDDVGLANVDGDAGLEVLTIGYGPGGDGVWYLDAATGAKERHVPSQGWPALRGPTVADLDGSGTTDWALSVHDGDRGGAFLVYETDAPCRVAYGGWQNHDPCRTTEAAQAAAGPFDATFSGVSGSEWWVQVQVDAGEPVQRVEARVDGGPWQPLEDKGWGWAASIHAPEGSTVEFRATGAGGATDVSQAYPWPPA